MSHLKKSKLISYSLTCEEAHQHSRNSHLLFECIILLTFENYSSGFQDNLAQHNFFRGPHIAPHYHTLRLFLKKNPSTSTLKTYLFMCVALQKSLSLSLSPQDLPQVHVLALITPGSDLISSLLSSVALKVVPLWILMTDWIGKWVIHLGKAGGMRGRGEENGEKVGEREREIAVLQSHTFSK